MLSKQFQSYYTLLKNTLKEPNFTGSELASLSAQYALKLVELEANVKLTQSEALKAIVQAESMVRSVRDNALISKANSYVGFLNTMLNATSIANNNQGGQSHSQNVIKTINAIDDSALSNYTEVLKELKDDILALTKKDN